MMSTWLFTILRDLFRSEYRKSRSEVVNGGQDRYRMRRRVSRLPGLTVGVVTDLV
jgi:DNA-directed RNA polymerase specialized sigma24 family protein